MKENLKGFACMLGVVYFSLFFLLTVGVMSTMSDDDGNCSVVRHIDFVFPVKPLACWLMQPVGDK